MALSLIVKSFRARLTFVSRCSIPKVVVLGWGVGWGGTKEVLSSGLRSVVRMVEKENIVNMWVCNCSGKYWKIVLKI